MKCIICGREAENKDYCLLHKKACENLKEKYEHWKKALGLSWRDYLIQVAENPFSGVKARQVAETILNEDK
ncbi:MAG: hypothetical protein JSV64_03850 [Candidatus Bathyarchaeota archaeon]|nr:MAG: hypothetical protein JSV64_03850 [Candidatus Bathyarchaeota archaeon]